MKKRYFVKGLGSPYDNMIFEVDSDEELIDFNGTTLWPVTGQMKHMNLFETFMEPLARGLYISPINLEPYVDLYTENEFATDNVYGEYFDTHEFSYNNFTVKYSYYEDAVVVTVYQSDKIVYAHSFLGKNRVNDVMEYFEHLEEEMIVPSAGEFVEKLMTLEI